MSRIDNVTCWRINYGLDHSPRDLEAMWREMVPVGALFALRVACAEIDRLRQCIREVPDSVSPEWKEKWAGVADSDVDLNSIPGEPEP